MAKVLNVQPLGKEPGEQAVKDLCAKLSAQIFGEVKPRVVLYWHLKPRINLDAQCRLGDCQKVPDLYRILLETDFIIGLCLDSWSRLKPAHRRALLHHELLHIAPLLDRESGAQKSDELGNPLWRIRKHSMEEFHDVVREYGAWKNDIQSFLQAAREGEAFIAKGGARSTPGVKAFLAGKSKADADALPKQPAQFISNELPTPGSREF